MELNQLGPGECVLFEQTEPPARYRYYCYGPWRPKKPNYNAGRARKEPSECILQIVDRMMRELGDRTWISHFPSAATRSYRQCGQTSRLREYQNVCIWPAGNHEARTSRAIAERHADRTFVATGTSRCAAITRRVGGRI